MGRVTQAEPIRRRSALRAGAGLTAALATGCAATERAATTATAPQAHRSTAAARAAPQPRRFPGQPAQIDHGPRTRDRVALTFHGQGDPAVARSVLKEAERAGAHVTVLAVGTWLDAHPDMARRILDGGHDLGNHTLHHIGVNDLSEADATAEITGCATRIRRLTGSVGTWFRPSRAQRATPLVTRLAERAGYPHVLSYDVDSLDFTSPGPAAVVDNVTSAVRPGSIVSLHFGYRDTIAALPPLLDHLARRGLSAVTCTELLS
ncbi:polysaccharide deacetylase family protein [Streptomyces sp. VRA16 Mangrove soil]|uniref:polysaccharide deacetylase family protein n=1 Tax=Streptomyces sp. VRA16 Mangrove soil TaxID=2817434 RepID=UPI001A9FB9FB|nr:polysaccharide deacetylase family protein [Streptomyces sp. VRA16 Mangrove soil]MBO1336417.1 polysaccharide deacetylase family protein [Streptomyces sp. VRA16 Mangrove soil]